MAYIEKNDCGRIQTAEYRIKWSIKYEDKVEGYRSYNIVYEPFNSTQPLKIFT